MTDRKQSLRDVLETAHQASWSVLSGLSPEECNVKVYAETPEAWTVRLVVAHLADAERGLLGQARRVLAGKSGVPLDFDRDRWNRSAVRRKASASLTALLQEIQDAHEEALSFLQDLDGEGMDRSGTGSMGYALTVEGFLRRMVEHRQEHVNDIRKAIGR
jgi:hypothetical protein